MLQTFFHALFGCSHQRTTFPLTPARTTVAPGGKRLGTYVVCLDCGKEFAYDWQQMKVVGPGRDNAAGVRSLATKEAS